MNRDSFVFYESFYKSIKKLDDKTQLEVFKAITEYALYHEQIEMSLVSEAIFEAFKPQIDANYKRYMSGIKGGRPKVESSEELEDKNQKVTKAKPNNNQKVTKAKPNVNDNVNVNVNENVNVKYKYGDHSHVLLTDDERLKLDEKYPNAKELIQFLDDYIEDKPRYGKEHKSHYRCIETWVVDAVNERKTKKKDIQVAYDGSKNSQLTQEEIKSLEEFRNE